MRIARIGLARPWQRPHQRDHRPAQCRDGRALRHLTRRCWTQRLSQSREDQQEEAGDLHRLSGSCSKTRIIDAISIATPNHWHTLMTIWACQAGKDVYVEKPCSHNIFEAKQIVAAARKYNRMVQQGSQSRSSVALQEGVQKMREGLIGDVYMARGLCFKWRDTIGRKAVSDPPAGVDYDLWPGPAPSARVHQEPLPLQLALVLGLRQRRSRQPGHSRSGHRALGPGREVSHQGQRHRRQVHVRRRPGDAEHPELRLRVQRETASSR